MCLNNIIDLTPTFLFKKRSPLQLYLKKIYLVVKCHEDRFIVNKLLGYKQSVKLFCVTLLSNLLY